MFTDVVQYPGYICEIKVCYGKYTVGLINFIANLNFSFFFYFHGFTAMCCEMDNRFLWGPERIRREVLTTMRYTNRRYLYLYGATQLRGTVYQLTFRT